MGRYPFIILCLLGGAKETDLIYEGIATCQCHCFYLDHLLKKLTWFTKGLRLVVLW